MRADPIGRSDLIAVFIKRKGGVDNILINNQIRRWKRIFRYICRKGVSTSERLTHHLWPAEGYIFRYID